VERARIVLRAAEGMQDKEIAQEFSITPEKSARWRNRFLEGGLAALEKDAPRPGRTPTITPARVQRVIDKTIREKPRNATHWSTKVWPLRGVLLARPLPFDLGAPTRWSDLAAASADQANTPVGRHDPVCIRPAACR